MSEGKTFFITGSNRGIGHELVKQILASNPSNKVIATLRKDLITSYVNDLFVTKDPRLTILKLDFEQPADFIALQIELAKLDVAIDVYISTAALDNATHDVLTSSAEEYIQYFKVNTIGPIETLKVLKPFILKKNTRKIIFTSSIYGSIGEFPYFLSSSYPSAPFSASKAALNSFGRELSYELKDDGFIVVNYFPGLIDSKNVSNAISHGDETDLELMEYAINNTVTLEEGVRRQLEMIENFTIKDSGKFISHDGLEIKY